MRYSVRNSADDYLISLIFILDRIVKFIDCNDWLTIVTFHKVLPQKDKNRYYLDNIVVTPDELRWFIEYCQRYYYCGSLVQSYHYWKAGGRDKPCLAITFDDGQLDNYLYAFPVLQDTGITATFFVPVHNVNEKKPLWYDVLGWSVCSSFHDQQKWSWITERIELEKKVDKNGSLDLPGIARQAIILAKQLDGEGLKELVDYLYSDEVEFPYWGNVMTWEMVRDLHEHGHEIGSHSCTHPILTKCSAKALRSEIFDSKKNIESKLRSRVESFCYPNGDYNDKIVKVVRDAGYRYGVTTRWGLNTIGDYPLTLNRIEIISSRLRSRRNGQLSEKWLGWRLSRLKDLYERVGKSGKRSSE